MRVPAQEELLGRVESDRAREALRQARAKEEADKLAKTQEYLETSEALVAAYVGPVCVCLCARARVGA